MKEDDSKHYIFQLKDIKVHCWFSDVIIQLSSVQIVSVQSSQQTTFKFYFSIVSQHNQNNFTTKL